MKRTSRLTRDPEKLRAWQRRPTTLEQRSAMKRRVPVRQVNRERRKAQSARNFGERAMVIRERQCLVQSHGLPASTGRIECYGSVQAAHVRARGMGGCNGSRRDLVPLCAAHHRQQHDVGVASFEELYALDLAAWACAIASELDELGIA